MPVQYHAGAGSDLYCYLFSAAAPIRPGVSREKRGNSKGLTPFDDMSWIETYRGTVYRWEVDNVDHFTVAFYFARLEDATQALLHAVHLDLESLAKTGQAGVTERCYVRYHRELRIGDILHIRSGIVGVDGDGLSLVHEVIDSGDGATCTTVEERVAFVERASRARRPL